MTCPIGVAGSEQDASFALPRTRSELRCGSSSPEPGSSSITSTTAGEELLIVLRGSPTVRMHDGDHVLQEGDVVPFPRGPEGGHQIRNDSEAVSRVLVVAAHANPDVAEYPDTGKVSTIIDGDLRFHRAGDEVEHGGAE